MGNEQAAEALGKVLKFLD